MTDEADAPLAPVRVPTGIRGLDDILGGGLFKGGIYIVSGAPGSGKTTFGNQMCFRHTAGGGRALYVTLLAETHARMLFQMRGMTFFDEAVVGGTLSYVNGFSAIETDGLEGLLRLVRRAVRDHHADVLVLDGMVTAGILARSGIDYKKFINELQTWVGVIGCTVLFLTSQSSEALMQPEHSMVDGILDLRAALIGQRAHRALTVTKFRGSAFIEGSHTYRITGNGVEVYPRTEAWARAAAPSQLPGDRLSTGVSRLDTILAGGLAPGATTLLLGSSGSGKTILGLQFLAAGVAAGEPVMHFGFFEPPSALLAKASRLGLPLARAAESGSLKLLWNPPTERLLDQMAGELLGAVRRGGVKRLVIDGMRGFHSAAHPERLSDFFAALLGELGDLGVTTMMTEETRELFITTIEVPTLGVSAMFHNILFLRQVDSGSELRRLLAVMKTRDSGHDRALYEFDIDDRGMRVLDRFEGGRPVFAGGSRDGAAVPSREETP